MKLAGPLKSAAGVKVTSPAVSDDRPVRAGVAVTAVTVSVCPDSFAGPLLSLSTRPAAGNTSEPSSATGPRVSSSADGASLTSVTVKLTVAVSVFGSATPLVVPLSCSV